MCIRDSARSLQSGHIAVGASEIALHGLLLPVLRSFRLSYPGVHIQITNHSTPQAVSAVKNGSVDFAIVTTPTGTVRPLKELPLIEYRDILIAGPHFISLAGKTLDINLLSEYPLISLERNTHTYEFYDRLFSKHGQVFQPDVEVATTDQVLPMVKYDLGLGFLPRSFAQDALDKKEVFEVLLKEAIPYRDICLVWDKSRPLSTAAQKLFKMIQSASLPE